VVILYTSGTTGPAKGVVISHAACINLGKVTAGVMEYDRDDTILAVFPLFHQNAKYKSLMSALDSDGRIVVASRFSASRFWDTCRAYDVTTFNYLSAMLLMLWNQPARADDQEHRARRACGAGAPTYVRRRFEERFGVRLTEVYGLTEAPMVTAQIATKSPAGSSGRTHGTYRLRIVDDAHQAAPANAVGGIEVRPLMPAVMMLRYHGPAQLTEEVWRDGWFQTGDRGWLDADGELHFAGRRKDSIRRRGENISAWEVETALAAHPYVQESAAYGVDSSLSDEEVMVAVTPSAGAQGDESDLAWAIWRHCNEHLPAFAVPRYIRLVSVLPRTATGRVEKWRLREEGVSDDAFDTSSWPGHLRRGSVPDA
jgi:crotonobetaine/carnitine-CoA ligase